jgi:hypothetical protein
MWKQVLIRELATVVALKLAVLFLIWHAFFAQPGKPEVTAKSVDRVLLGSSRDTNAPPSNQLATQE